MKLFRPAGEMKGCSADPWTRGSTEKSEFFFPDIYLSDQMEALCGRDTGLPPFLEECLRRFTDYDYGPITSLEAMDNIVQRQLERTNNWMFARWPSDAWEDIYFQIFYDMALFHRKDEPQKDRVREQNQKEKAAVNR